MIMIILPLINYVQGGQYQKANQGTLTLLVSLLDGFLL